MDLALNNLQSLICYQNQPTNQPLTRFPGLETHHQILFSFTNRTLFFGESYVKVNVFDCFVYGMSTFVRLFITEFNNFCLETYGFK